MKRVLKMTAGIAVAAVIAQVAVATGGEPTGLPPDRITGIWDLLLRTLGL